MKKKANRQRELQRRRRGGGVDYHWSKPLGGAALGTLAGVAGGALEGLHNAPNQQDPSFLERWLGMDEVKDQVNPLASAASQAIERGAQGAAAGGGLGVLSGGIDQLRRRRLADQYDGYTTQQLERMQ